MKGEYYYEVLIGGKGLRDVKEKGKKRKEWIVGDFESIM